MSEDKVKEFYDELPFNFSQDTNFFVQSIKDSNQVLEYTDLHHLLRNKNASIKSVIEFGCGTGWLTNTIAYYYRKEVTSIDFTSRAIDVANKVNKLLGLNSIFKLKDIFDYQDPKLYDLVISMGVLHHTVDCKKALKAVSKFVKPGGYLYVGLYHLYGRKPMLELLQNYAFWHGEESAYNLFKRMNRSMNKSEFSYSWFRDQVLHPRESLHTFLEINEWLKELSFKACSTSINNFKELSNSTNNDLELLEKSFEEMSYKSNIEQLRFSPGFFTVCAKNNK